MSPEKSKTIDFIREAVAEDLRTGRFSYVRTRLLPSRTVIYISVTLKHL